MSSFVWVLEYPANHVFQMSYDQQDDSYGGGDNYGERRGGGRGERRQEEYGNQDNYGSGQQGGYSGGQQDYGSQGGGQGGYGGGREEEYGVWIPRLLISFVFLLYFILETYADSHYFRVQRDAMKVTLDARREDTEASSSREAMEVEETCPKAESKYHYLAKRMAINSLVQVMVEAEVMEEETTMT